MPTNLIINPSNFNDATQTNGKIYSNGGNYACNYPLVDLDNSLSITSTVGSKYITTTDDFTVLLGCDIQNNNVPVKKWLIGPLGEIFEIDYIISTTSAALKQVSSYAVTGDAFYVIDYWGSRMVEETTLENTDGFPSVGVLANTKTGALTLNLYSGQSINLGQEPISVDLGSTGSQCQINNNYTN